MAYGLGIDTGGTYTDSVIIDMESGKILSTSKALTTRDDLSVGIGESVSGLDADLLKAVSLTSLSSTLATNSVVESKGCRVGLISIGKSYNMAVQPACYAEVAGRFSMNGNVETPLDKESARSAVESMKGKVDAIAIAGYLSVRNPSHEDVIAGMVAEILGVPTVCTHMLTSKLGYEQRTTTAILNAGLIPVITELISSMKDVMERFGITSPLMIVKGDGSLMNAETAVTRPVETILSGPASSITGARAMTGADNAMVIDVGGTTTDIGILRNGVPRIEPEGALIGGRRTRVEAADISTFGIGGDSRIFVNGRDASLSPVRVIPMCIAANMWDSVKATVAALESVTEDRAHENYPPEKIIQDTEFFTLARSDFTDVSKAEDRAFLEYLANGPSRIRDAAAALDVAPRAFSVSDLESRGYITRIGVTPTDILAAAGEYKDYDTESSCIVVGYLARRCRKETEAFISDMKKAITRKMAAGAMEKALLDGTSSDILSESQNNLLSICLNNCSCCYSLGFTLDMPIIGIGAPAGAWLPGVADLLHTRLILPESSEMGNAVGAITGSVSESVSATIRFDDLAREYNVFIEGSIERFQDQEDALEFARARCSESALKRAISSGADEAVINPFEELENDLSGRLRKATVTAKATGRPGLRRTDT